MSTTLTTGAGTEQFVLNVVKNAPLGKFKISIVQTDMQDTARLAPQYVNDVLKNVDVYTIRSFRRHLRRFENASGYATMALKVFITYVFSTIYRLVNGSVLARIGDSDLVYLIRNDDLPYLKIDKRRTVVLGSTHCSTLTLGARARGLHRLRKWFRVLKYRKIDGFHFTSEKWYKQSVLHKNHDFILPLGTDTDLYHPTTVQAEKKGKVRFIFVSRLESDKGVTRLLDAWAMMSGKNAELHIAGTGSMVGVVKKRADTRRIFYHGVLSNEDLAALYRSCDVFVFPSQGEIYGLVVLEALASGLFAIVSEDLRGNFDEFERMGVLEYVRNEPATIFDSMSRVVSNIEKARGLRQAVYGYIRANNDWQSLTAKLFSTFERILSRQS